MSHIISFEDHVQTATIALGKMIEKQKENPDVDSGKWLETLFKHYSDRMLSDNERIWRTGALFIPVSLAAFAALANIKCLMFWHTLIL